MSNLLTRFSNMFDISVREAGLPLQLVDNDLDLFIINTAAPKHKIRVSLENGQAVFHLKKDVRLRLNNETQSKLTRYLRKLNSAQLKAKRKKLLTSKQNVKNFLKRNS